MGELFLPTIQIVEVDRPHMLGQPVHSQATYTGFATTKSPRHLNDAFFPCSMSERVNKGIQSRSAASSLKKKAGTGRMGKRLFGKSKVFKVRRVHCHLVQREY